MMVWQRALLGISGLMGAAGVGLGAAAAHAGFGPNLMLAATFLILHAAPVLAIALIGPQGKLWRAAAFLLAGGAILFSAQLSVGAIFGTTLFPMAAPTGGWGMILGWLAVAGAGALGGGLNRRNVI